MTSSPPSRSPPCRAAAAPRSSSRASSSEGLRGRLLRELRRRGRAVRGARAHDRADPVRHRDREPLHAPRVRLRADRGADPRALGRALPLRRGRLARARERAPRRARGQAARRHARVRRGVSRRTTASASCRPWWWRRCASAWSRSRARSATASCSRTPRARTCARRSSALPPARRSDPAFFVGDMIPICISDDRAAAMERNRKTLVMYVSLPNYRNYWTRGGLRRGDGRDREGDRARRARPRSRR